MAFIIKTMTTVSENVVMVSTMEADSEGRIMALRMMGSMTRWFIVFKEQGVWKEGKL